MVPVHYGDATKSQRLANFVVDFFGFSFLAGMVQAALVLTTGRAAEGIAGSLVGYAATLAYYLVLEAATGRTLGKLFTGTRVVGADGRAPSIRQVALRSLVRFVPFELFSCLSDEGGWHDQWSRTRVVRLRPTKLDRIIDQL